MNEEDSNTLNYLATDENTNHSSFLVKVFLKA